jgi:peptidoglycan/xylan/chitin deacetylase (PgdA/CDA1 family)
MVECMGFWPEGYQSCFFLSFDYDASSAEMWKTPLDIVAQSKGRYSPKVAVPRILDLLDRLELKSTFFVPGWTADNHSVSVAEIISRGHEVGHHGYIHERITEISWEAEEGVFDDGYAALERLGVKPMGYRAPYWLVSERTFSHLKRLGFRYSSNFMDDDMPYMLKHRGIDTGLVELPVDWLLDDWPQFETSKKSPTEVYSLWKPEFDGLHRLGRYFGLTCHPECIGRISRLDMLEKLVKEAIELDKVWFPTGSELAEWVRKNLDN